MWRHADLARRIDTGDAFALLIRCFLPMLRKNADSECQHSSLWLQAERTHCAVAPASWR